MMREFVSGNGKIERDKRPRPIDRQEFVLFQDKNIAIEGEITYSLMDNWHLLVRTYDIFRWMRPGFTIDLVWWMQVFQKNTGGHSVCARGHPCDHIGHPM